MERVADERGVPLALTELEKVAPLLKMHHAKLASHDEVANEIIAVQSHQTSLAGEIRFS